MNSHIHRFYLGTVWALLVAALASLSVHCGALSDAGPISVDAPQGDSPAGRTMYLLAQDGTVRHFSWDAGTWRTVGAPSALIGLGSDRDDAFATDTTGNLWRFDGQVWTDISYGTTFAGAPATTNVRLPGGVFRRYVLAVRTDGALVSLSSEGDEWTTETVASPVQLAAPPYVIQHFGESGDRRVTALTRAVGGGILEHTLRDGSWSTTTHFAGVNIQAAPSADVIYRPDLIVDLFAVDEAGQLRRRAFSDEMWGVASDLGRPEATGLAGSVVVVAHIALSSHLSHAFVVGQDGRLYEFRWANHAQRWRSHDGPSNLVGGLRAAVYDEDDQRVLRVWCVDSDGRLNEGTSRAPFEAWVDDEESWVWTVHEDVALRPL